jgi:hypothetical protein
MENTLMHHYDHEHTARWTLSITRSCPISIRLARSCISMPCNFHTPT